VRSSRNIGHHLELHVTAMASARVLSFHRQSPSADLACMKLSIVMSAAIGRAFLLPLVEKLSYIPVERLLGT
jgi:hypothetical protein